MISHKISLSWERKLIEEETILGVPKGTIRERKKQNPYPSYVDLMRNLINKEPTCFVEIMKQK